MMRLSVILAVSLAMTGASASASASAKAPECDRECAKAKGWPVPIQRHPPQYPRGAMREGVQGCVVASFEIKPDGKPEKLEVLDAQPPRVFDAAVTRALKDWRFEVPEKPGRYATRLDFYVEGVSAKPHPGCIETPGFDALNNAPAAVALPVGAPASAEAGSWTPEQLEQIFKLIKNAKVATDKTTPEQQAQMRASGQPVEMLRGAPKFAESKLEQDVYGCVVVSFEILNDGKTDEFEVVKASRPGMFDMLAMRAVMASEFEPPSARAGPRPRHHKALLVLIPEPPPKKHSVLNERKMAEREARRDELRAKCEAQAP